MVHVLRTELSIHGIGEHQQGIRDGIVLSSGKGGER